MGFFKREQPTQPLESFEDSPMMKEVNEVNAEIEELEDYQTTPEADAFRDSLKDLPEKSPRYQAIIAMAYSGLPKFFRESKGFPRSIPEEATRKDYFDSLMANQRFNEIRDIFNNTAWPGAKGAKFSLSRQEIEGAWDLLQEYYRNAGEQDENEEKAAA